MQTSFSSTRNISEINRELFNRNAVSELNPTNSNIYPVYVIFFYILLVKVTFERLVIVVFNLHKITNFAAFLLIALHFLIRFELS